MKSFAQPFCCYCRAAVRTVYMRSTHWAENFCLFFFSYHFSEDFGGTAATSEPWKLRVLLL